MRRSSSRPRGCSYPQAKPFNLAGPGLRLAVGFERKGELDVRTSDGDERAGLRGAAIEGCELRVDKGDEVQVAAIQEVGEAAAVALPGKRQVADDSVPVGLQHNTLDPSLHTLNIS